MPDGHLRDPATHAGQSQDSPLDSVPKEWRVLTLGDVGDWHAGGTPSKDVPRFWNGDIPWLTPKDMKRFRLGQTTDYITRLGAANGTRVVAEGSIFIVVRGMILAHTFPVSIGMARMAFNQDIRAVTDNGTVCPVYLGYWFLGNESCMLGLATEATHGTKRLDMSDVRRQPIALPPRREQEAIAEILDTADEAIRGTEALVGKLKAMKAGLLDDLLTRGLDEHGHLRDPATHPEQFKDSPLGRVPVKWRVGRLEDLAVNHDGRRVPIKQANRDKMRGIYPYYGASGIIDWVNDYLFEGDYVLLGEDGENVESRRLPLAFTVSGKFWVNNHAHVFEPLRGVDIRFLTELLEATDYSSVIIGSAQPKLTQNGLSKLRFAIPPNSEQRRISVVLGTHDARIRAEEAYLEKLKLQKKGLMHDLLTGRVRVGTR